MCYTGSCPYEDAFGECRKPRRELCPMEYGEGFDPADDGRDVLCDQLYEQQRDDALMEGRGWSLS